MKRTFTLILAMLMIFSALMFTGCSNTAVEDPGTLMDMTITFLKIGRADSAIINTGTHIVVIDSGEEEDGVEISDYLSSNGITKIDKLILSNYDKNCTGGADVLIKNFEVGEILGPNYQKNNEDFLQMSNALEEKSLLLKTVKFKTTFTYDATEFVITPCVKANYILDKDSEHSLCISITHGDMKYLFVGNALTDRTAEIIKAEVGQHDFLKIPNYGVWFEGLDEFVSYISPKNTIISCSDKNPPEDVVIEAIEALGARAYQTRDGNTQITCTGSSMSVNIY